MTSLAKNLFTLGYQKSPIILTNGLANLIDGSMLPIIAITQAANFTSGILSGDINLDMNNFFANFKPLPGSTLLDYEVGDYPFANQQYAANAVIQRPLRLSMLMTTPASTQTSYVTKIVTFTALKYALDSHISQGGTFTVATPAYIYTNCLLVGMTDVSIPESNQVQNAWQLDFVRPLITLNQAQNAQNQLNTLMSNIQNQNPTNGLLSGAENTINNPSAITSQIAGGGQNMSGAGVGAISTALIGQ